MSDAVLTIDVILDDVIEVNGSAGKATMILFHGSSTGESFNGKILPGGVDTQKEPLGEKRFLSARYVLEGVDCEGQECRIFIENNGLCGAPGEIIKTKPLIYTDSKALKWLENADLTGTVEGKPGGVLISFFKDED